MLLYYKLVLSTTTGARPERFPLNGSLMRQRFTAGKLITLVMRADKTVQKLDATAAIGPDSDRGLHRAVIQPLHKS